MFLHRSGKSIALGGPGVCHRSEYSHQIPVGTRAACGKAVLRKVNQQVRPRPYVTWSKPFHHFSQLTAIHQKPAFQQNLLQIITLSKERCITAEQHQINIKEGGAAVITVIPLKPQEPVGTESFMFPGSLALSNERNEWSQVSSRPPGGVVEPLTCSPVGSTGRRGSKTFGGRTADGLEPNKRDVTQTRSEQNSSSSSPPLRMNGAPVEGPPDPRRERLANINTLHRPGAMPNEAVLVQSSAVFSSEKG
ncbi:unnamed protein product [Boreogadus saida]